jgi:hypothetical protein
LALRSRIVLACADGRPNTKIADELGCDRVTVGKWRHRFAADRLEGLEGLVDAPRPGAARTICDEVVEVVIVETLETTPKDDPRTPHTGRPGRWPSGTGSADRPSVRSGVPSGSSPGDKTSSRSRPIRT